MKGRSCLPNDPKIIVCICFGPFWICNKMLSYGRITFHFRIRVFTHTRWHNTLSSAPQDHYRFLDINFFYLFTFTAFDRLLITGKRILASNMIYVVIYRAFVCKLMEFSSLGSNFLNLFNIYFTLEIFIYCFIIIFRVSSFPS